MLDKQLVDLKVGLMVARMELMWADELAGLLVERKDAPMESMLAARKARSLVCQLAEKKVDYLAAS